jgi:uncharacterized membrane protein YdjX (TVP38/TMEM64 family)
MRGYQRLLAVVLFLGVIFATFQLSGLREHFSLDFLRQQIIEHQVWGLALFVVLFSLGNLIQIPGWIFLAAAVLALGRTGGGLATYVAASVSCALTFVAIRLVGGDALRELNSDTVGKVIRRLDAHPIRSIILARTLFQTAPPLNYALALSGVNFRNYMLGTLLGLPLPIFLYCLFFDYLETWLGIR